MVANRLQIQSKRKILVFLIFLNKVLEWKKFYLRLGPLGSFIGDFIMGLSFGKPLERLLEIAKKIFCISYENLQAIVLKSLVYNFTVVPDF